MSLNRLLQKQINKYLNFDYSENLLFKEFIKSVNDSYMSFERDKELMNHAFNQSEKEYYEINESLKKEVELKKQSIANLYDSIEFLEDGFENITNKDDAKDLLFISKYLSRQIEKRKETENNLLTTVELLKTLLANLQSGILVEDENRKILFTNQLFCDMFSVPINPDLMIGLDCTNSAEESKVLFKKPEEFSLRIDEILKNRTIVTNELFEMVNNQFLERDYIPIFINNEYKGHLWKYTDITQRIENQNLIEQSEESNRLIMNAALNAIINIDSEGKIMFWNKQAESIFGWLKEEVVGKNLSETIVPGQHIKGHNEGMKRYLKTGQGNVLNKQIELTGIHKNGNEFPIEISITPIKLDDKIFFCSFIQDISLRKKAEKDLKFQEEKYRNIIANMNLGLIEVDNNEIIQYANQSFSTISGFEIAELIGKNPSKLFVFGENLDIIDSKKDFRKKGISDIYQIPIKNKRGELRWWAISGAPNFDDKGNLVGSIGIHLDITDQKQLEIELENEKLKAEEASRAKEAFLANMSHEIRTPLNAIIGFLRELEKQEVTDLQQKYIENSSKASKHLLAIINNILDISKIESGEMSLEQEDFILEETITKVLNILKPKADQKGIALTSKLSKNIYSVLNGDALRIEQILFNLVGNSLKFTQKGHIIVSCTVLKEDKKSQELCITIEDSGIGMDENYVKTIFKKFSQEDKAVTRKFGGTGLGMTITKELVQLMNGRIEVTSLKNIGTTIQIFINLVKGNIENAKNIKKPITEFDYVSLSGISILHVEDNEMNRMVAQNTLQYFNCKVTEAQNGLEAIDFVLNQTFDIILMDIQMPEMDGIEATKIIRNKLKVNTPIIALTANAFKTEIEKCKKAGMNDYVTKPFDEKILIETIAKHTIKKNNVAPLKNKTMPTPTKKYDLTSIIAMSRGNNDFVIKMITIFVNQTTETFDKIETAFASNNFQEISNQIHKIKPSIEGLGILSITEEVKNLEKIAKETENKEAMKTLFTTIKSTLVEVIELFKTNELK